jgi:hypothetical protein
MKWKGFGKGQPSPDRGTTRPLLGATAENHDQIQDGQFHDKGSNCEPHKYETRVLLLLQL